MKRKEYQLINTDESLELDDILCCDVAEENEIIDLPEDTLNKIEFQLEGNFIEERIFDVNIEIGECEKQCNNFLKKNKIMKIIKTETGCNVENENGMTFSFNKLISYFLMKKSNYEVDNTYETYEKIKIELEKMKNIQKLEYLYNKNRLEKFCNDIEILDIDCNCSFYPIPGKHKITYIDELGRTIIDDFDEFKIILILEYLIKTKPEKLTFLNYSALNYEKINDNLRRLINHFSYFHHEMSFLDIIVKYYPKQNIQQIKRPYASSVPLFFR
jgi:hypothetical protein